MVEPYCTTSRYPFQLAAGGQEHRQWLSQRFGTQASALARCPPAGLQEPPPLLDQNQECRLWRSGTRPGSRIAMHCRPLMPQFPSLSASQHSVAPHHLQDLLSPPLFPRSSGPRTRQLPLWAIIKDTSESWVFPCSSQSTNGGPSMASRMYVMGVGAQPGAYTLPRLRRALIITLPCELGLGVKPALSLCWEEDLITFSGRGRG